MVYLDLILVGFGHVGRRFARLLEEKSGCYVWLNGYGHVVAIEWC